MSANQFNISADISKLQCKGITEISLYEFWVISTINTNLSLSESVPGCYVLHFGAEIYCHIP